MSIFNKIKNQANKYYSVFVVENIVKSMFENIVDEKFLDDEFKQKYKDLGVSFYEEKNGKQKTILLNEKICLIKDKQTENENIETIVGNIQIRPKTIFGVSIKYKTEGEIKSKTLLLSDFCKSLSSDELKKFNDILWAFYDKIRCMDRERTLKIKENELRKGKEDSDIIRSVFN